MEEHKDGSKVNMTSGMTSQMVGFSSSSARGVGVPLLHDLNLETDKESLTSG